MLEFKQDGVVHTGFKRLVSPSDFVGGVMLVLAWFDGEPELWLVENPTGLQALKAFYRAEWGSDRVTFQVFLPLGAMGFPFEQV